MRALRIGAAVVFILESTAANTTRPWVIDGDTFDFDGERVRVENLDSPEIGERSRCALERRRGYAAKKHAIELMRRGSRFEVYGRDHVDRFGRTIARLRIDGKDFGQLMVSAGLSRPWRGKPSNWCQ